MRERAFQGERAAQAHKVSGVFGEGVFLAQKSPSQDREMVQQERKCLLTLKSRWQRSYTVRWRECEAGGWRE